MQCLGWLAMALCAMQVTSLPVSSEMSADDTKVMKCVVEVISDTLSKPNAVPISPECLETLRGDERIISILHHQNLLKELKELATKGAKERVKQEKKRGSFAEELSKVLEHPGAASSDRDKSKEVSSEDSAASSTEARGDKREKDSETNASEETRTILEPREQLEHEDTPEEEEDQDNQAGEQLESNEIGDHEEALRDDSIDNHVTDAMNAEELSEEKHHEHEEQPEETNESRELKEEKEHVTKKHHEGKEEEYVDDDNEEERHENLEESDTKTSQEEEDETQRKIGNQEEALDSEKEEKIFGSDDKSHEDIGEIHHLENDMKREDETSQPKEFRSEERAESSSKEVLDAKRWNKMDELAKELTSKKRMAGSESEEDPDRSMRMPIRARKYNFNSQEREVRRSWPHPSSEDSGERGLETAIRPSPEEKKDEEGSANRRTEDQELESLAAIEAELEKVAHKLHELRRA